MPDKTHTTEPAQTRAPRSRNSGALTAADVLAVQRSAGNRAAQQLIAQRRVQARLTVGPVDDPFEREADRMADAVLSSPLPTREGREAGAKSSPLPRGEAERPGAVSPTGRSAPWGLGVGNDAGVQREATPEEDELQTKPLAAQITPLAQREAKPEEDEEVQRQAEEEDDIAQTKREVNPTPNPSPEGRGEIARQGSGVMVQRNGDGSFNAGADVEQRIARSKGAGSALPDATRAEMEGRFGADFSGVRVHAGDEAAQLNRDLSAQAFTHGSDVYFGEGKFSPASGEGKHLLAHELTHVVQQVNTVSRFSLRKLNKANSQQGLVAIQLQQTNARGRVNRSTEQVDNLIERILNAIAQAETQGRAVESSTRTSAGVAASYRSQVQTTLLNATDAMDRMLSKDQLEGQFGLTKSEVGQAADRRNTASTLWERVHSLRQSIDANAFISDRDNATLVNNAGFNLADMNRVLLFHDVRAQIESLRGQKIKPKEIENLVSQSESAQTLGFTGPNLRPYIKGHNKWAEDKAAWQRLAVERLTTPGNPIAVGERIRIGAEANEGLTLGYIVVGFHARRYINSHPEASDREVCEHVAERHNPGGKQEYKNRVLSHFEPVQQSE